MKNIIKKTVGILLICAIVLPMLTGCSNNVDNTAVQTNAPATAATQAPVVSEKVDAVPVAENLFEGMIQKQINSMMMMNHLAVLSRKISSSKNSRMYLEEAYSSIINNSSPTAIDDLALGVLDTLLDTLEEYRMIAVKRDRLTYIYEQNKAQAIRNALPSPLTVLSAVQLK